VASDFAACYHLVLSFPLPVAQGGEKNFFALTGQGAIAQMQTTPVNRQ